MKFKFLLYIFTFLFIATSNAETTFIWGISTELHYFNKVAIEFKNTIESKTNGRVKIIIQKYDDLKNEKSSQDFFKENKYHIHQQLAGNYYSQSPNLKIWNIPFLFKNDQHVEKYLNSKKAQDNLKLLENDDLLPIDYTFSGGFIYAYGPKPLQAFSDLEGKKLSIMYDFGFNSDFLKPKNIDITLKTYTIVDNEFHETLGSDLADLLGIVDLEKTYFTVTNHRIISRILFVSKKQIEKMTQHDRNIFISELKKFARKERALANDGKKLSLELFKNRGHHLHFWNKNDIKKAQEYFRGSYDMYYKNLKSEIDFIHSL